MIEAATSGALLHGGDDLEYENKIVAIDEMDSIPQDNGPIASSFRAGQEDKGWKYRTTYEGKSGHERNRQNINKGSKFSLLVTGTKGLEKQQDTGIIEYRVPEDEKHQRAVLRTIFSEESRPPSTVNWDLWQTWNKLIDVFPAGVTVSIPFEIELGDLVAEKREYASKDRAKRDSKQLLSAIRVVTKLRHMSDTELPETIYSTTSDYGIVRDVFGPAIANVAGTLSPARQKVYDIVKEHTHYNQWGSPEGQYTIADIAEEHGTSRVNVTKLLKGLQEMGLVTDSLNKQPKVWWVTSDSPDKISLPSKAQLEKRIKLPPNSVPDNGVTRLQTDDDVTTQPKFPDMAGEGEKKRPDRRTH